MTESARDIARRIVDEEERGDALTPEDIAAEAAYERADRARAAAR